MKPFLIALVQLGILCIVALFVERSLEVLLKADADAVWDYSFTRGGAAFYVLDGRGHRDVERDGYRILGQPQFRRFEAWADALDPEETPFMFVVSAVPVLHARSAWRTRTSSSRFARQASATICAIRGSTASTTRSGPRSWRCSSGRRGAACVPSS